jgi:hypothetical protein
MASRKIWMRICVTLSILLVALMAVGFFSFTASGAAPAKSFVGTTQEVHFSRKLAPASFAQSQLPSWSSSFAYNGRTYTYSMVGTDPAKGPATTTVPVTLVPLKLTFSNGVAFDGTQKVQSTTASPLFQPAPFNTDTTQYGDAIQRAEFWNSVSKTSPQYHVLLGTPTIAATVSLNIPAASGKTERDPSGKTIGLIDQRWLDVQLRSLLIADHFTSTMLPIFLANNIYLYPGKLKQCCIGGYHSTVQNSAGLQTYIWSTNADAGIQGGFGEDVSILSHEVAEWFNDPFNSNVVPNWTSPLAPRYGCDNTLEVGDPLVKVVFTVTGFSSYHLQDEAFFSWFARQSPSIALNGLYTYLGTFKTLSKLC